MEGTQRSRKGAGNTETSGNMEIESNTPRPRKGAFSLLMIVVLTVIATIAFMEGEKMFTGEMVGGISEAIAPAILELPKTEDKKCDLEFLSYQSSPWEKEWIDNVEAWSKDKEMCEHMSKEQIAQFLKGTREATSTKCGHLLEDLGSEDNAKIFSQFKWMDTCTGREVTTYIEPLVGLMRSPECPCATGDAGLLDRDYIMYGRTSPQCKNMKYPELANEERFEEFFFFDLGASVYTQGMGGASQKVFVDGFDNLGVSPKDVHYFAWEVQKKDPVDVWGQIPGVLKPHYHWFNIPSDPAPGSSDNPWTYLKTLCTKRDYVVVKLDIDNTPVETAFMEQLLADTELQGLIDEMFFEHHVNVEHMYPYWVTQTVKEQLKDSYAWFAKLRNLGIRFHGWP